MIFEFISMALPIYAGPVGELGTPIYTMGAENWIKLNYDLDNGSGSGDMFAYIPNWLFGDGKYVYLYSKFGVHEAF